MTEILDSPAPQAVPSRPKAGAAPTHGPGSPVPEQSRAERQQSFEVADFPLPNGREEDWRFTPVARLRGLFTPAATEPASYQVSSAPGVSSPELSSGQTPRGSALTPGDRAAVLAHAGMPQAGSVVIAADAELSAPIVVEVSSAARSAGHLVIAAGAHSVATVIVNHRGGGEHTGNIEMLVGPGARLTVISVQRWDNDAIHLGQHSALVHRDAQLKHVVITLGGSIVRLNTTVEYAGPGASAILHGVYFADSGQHLEHRSFVNHSAAQCTSEVTYKGALQGDTARTVWVGDVLIQAGAEGTETYELNRNLLLSPGARADSVPNLEIKTGQIAGAGHASATGRFDDEQLFYLQARGIPEAEARRLVVRGFFADLIGQLQLPDLESEIMTAIEAELEGAGA